MVEYKYQYSLNVTRSLLFQDNMPIQFWGDCVSPTALIMNRNPSEVLQGKLILNFCLIRLKPVMNLECLIACATRFIPCVFVGYPVGYKGFKLYNLSSGTFHIYRDIVFHEDTYPFHTLPQTNQCRDPFPNLVLPNPIQEYINVFNDEKNPAHDNTLGDDPRHDFGHPHNQIIIPSIRNSTRSHKPPSYLQKFVYHTLYPITHTLA